MHRVGDVVRHNDKLYEVVKEMACWERFQLTSLEGEEVLWKDGRTLEKLEGPVVGVGWDDRMLLHSVPSEGVSVLDLPERPGRCSTLWEALEQDEAFKSYKQIDFKEATHEEVCLVHDPAYYEQVMACDQSCITDTANEVLTPITPDTPLAALLAVGCCVTMLRLLLSNAIDTGYCIVRPPGHHAVRSSGMGFCIFNNVAITAAVALKEFASVKKVLILDWDVHHGNGVQDAFYETAEVLYVSLHVSCGGRFYPGTGRLNETGERDGEGHNVNIPWRHTDVTDDEMQLAFAAVVLPIVQEFGPDVVLVSAGYDAGEGDPLGMCHVTPQCFAWMTRQLMSFKVPFLVALEGGYNERTVTESSLAVLEALRSSPYKISPYTNDKTAIEAAAGKVHRSAALSLLLDAVRMQKQHWSCLDPIEAILEEHEKRALRDENVKLMMVWRLSSYFVLRLF
eukprot:TRINITY_DN10323_c1_g1_i1.p1 TRINITY_DN10323_c1_g1~~TRINITY_DN10323_c1_g1_i1.p1  ORF type:complete len:452 (+),score=132.39 TRINITY_DN10323_c1_g1_i1:42-1397(+)